MTGRQSQVTQINVNIKIDNKTHMVFSYGELQVTGILEKYEGFKRKSSDHYILVPILYISEKFN